MHVITDLQSCYSASNDVFRILQFATFFDPRFKSKPFSDPEVEDIKERIILEVITLPPAAVPPSQPCCSLTEPPPAKRKKSLGTFFKEHEEDQQASSSTSTSPSMEDRCRKEIENYLRTPKLDFEDPLLWWKTASLKLSILSHKARKYLCVCATSSPSERAFSCSGNIVTPLRASMNPLKVDMLTFLSKKLK